MKFNPVYAFGGLFVAAVLGTGALLLRAPDGGSSALQAGPEPELLAKADSPKAPAPPPADERIVIKRILPISGPIKYGEWHWDEKNVPAGPLVITVDLDARVLSVFRGGYEIGATAVLLGTAEKPTDRKSVV